MKNAGNHVGEKQFKAGLQYVRSALVNYQRTPPKNPFQKTPPK